jgi:hypothetical protein
MATRPARKRITIERKSRSDAMPNKMAVSGLLEFSEPGEWELPLFINKIQTFGIIAVREIWITKESRTVFFYNEAAGLRNQVHYRDSIMNTSIRKAF